jgi:hypothetical protein
VGKDRSSPAPAPPRRSILDWIRVKRITPNDPDMSDDDLAFVIARSIVRKGTPAQPYLEPALRSKTNRIYDLVRQGAERGLREAGL